MLLALGVDLVYNISPRIEFSGKGSLEPFDWAVFLPVTNWTNQLLPVTHRSYKELNPRSELTQSNLCSDC